MNIPRILLTQVEKAIQPGKVVVLYGPRQVGKTTLLRQLLAVTPLRHKFINVDELQYQEALASQDRRILGDLVGDNDLLVIDEAQRVENIGINLKILVDSFPETAFVATGSASFDLANKISEPLTGRKITFNLFPVSFPELSQEFGEFETKQQLERWLVWGAYPEIARMEDASIRSRLLNELVGSYLYRDVLELEGLRRADKIVDLLRLVAFQIGQEVSLAELAGNLAINRKTVERYLDLLEKVFVIYRVSGFSRNLRKEVSKSSRYYFYDNGVRNALLQNFSPLHLRSDIGQLWENYLMVERLKRDHYQARFVNRYFWRTYDQKEIDLVEETGGMLHGFEFKWGAHNGIKRATREMFLKAYPGAVLEVVNQENFSSFVSD